MEGKIQHFRNEGYGFITPSEDPNKSIYFHITNVDGELKELIEAKKFKNEPITFETRSSKVKGRDEAFNIKLNLGKRSVGYVTFYEKEEGFGQIEEFYSKEKFHIHYTKILGTDKKFIHLEKDEPVVFTKATNEKGNEAIDLMKVDVRSPLEYFANFDNFSESLLELKSLAEEENWDYIKKPSTGIPVLYSYINYTFQRILDQDKLVNGKSSKDGKEYAYFNTGLVTQDQDEIYGYLEKIPNQPQNEGWQIHHSEYDFLEFNTDKSHHRKYFSSSPEIATYFTEAEVRELIFDTSLNNGEIIVDKEHIEERKGRFEDERIKQLEKGLFYDALKNAIELAKKRVKRNYKTAIPHFYDGKIQFLLPLCMINKKDADAALVVKKEESVYKADTVLNLDQAYNNARLLAKPDREWLNP